MGCYFHRRKEKRTFQRAKKKYLDYFERYLGGNQYKKVQDTDVNDKIENGKELHDTKDDIGDRHNIQFGYDFEDRDYAFIYLDGEIIKGKSGQTHAQILENYMKQIDKEEDIPEDYRVKDTDVYPLSWQVFEGNDKLWAYIPVNTEGLFTAKKANYLTNTVLASAKTNGVKIPTYAYWKRVDEIVLDHAVELSATVTLQKEDPDNLPTADAIQAKVNTIKSTATAEEVNPFNVPDCVGNEEGVTENYQSILRNFGYWKFTGQNDALFENWEASESFVVDKANNKLRLFDSTDFYFQTLSDVVDENNQNPSVGLSQKGAYLMKSEIDANISALVIHDSVLDNSVNIINSNIVSSRSSSSIVSSGIRKSLTFSQTFIVYCLLKHVLDDISKFPFPLSWF